MATSNSGKLLSDVTERIALTSGWSGLVRWSLALGRISNESTCAAERAIVAAQMSVDCESKREWLVRKLEWFRDDFQSQLGSDEERSILGAISFEWNWEEVSTLELLHLWPLVTLCDGGSQLPPEHARQALTIGRDAAEACALLCHKLNDDVLLSTCFNQVGASYAYLGDHDRARTYYQRALHLRVRLAERLPTIYRKFVAGTMNNLGNALWNSGDLDAAATTLTDALNIRSELAESGVPDMTADIAITENDLANVLLELGRQTDAGKYYLSALKRFQILAQSFPDTYLEECARTSFNIAMNTLLSGDSTLALKQVQGSLEFWRRAQPYPAQKQLPLVEALIGESKIQLSLGNVQESVDSVSESINILDLLAGMCPDRFGEHYASALNQFGACAGLRKDHPLARRAHEKALEIYEWVRKRVPTTKRNIKVGSTLCLLADVLIDAGDHDAARKKVEEALLIYSSLPDEAKTAYGELIGDAHHTLGTIALETGDYSVAMAELQKAVDLRSVATASHQVSASAEYKLCGSLNNMASAAKSSGQLELALQIVDKALKNPGLSDSKMGMTLKAILFDLQGTIFDDVKDLQSAHVAISLAIDLKLRYCNSESESRQLAMSYYHRALVAFQAGNYAAAEADCVASARVLGSAAVGEWRDRSLMIRNKTLWALLLRRDGRTEEALEALDDARATIENTQGLSAYELNTLIAINTSNRGAVLVRLDRFAEARQLFDNAVEAIEAMELRHPIGMPFIRVNVYGEYGDALYQEWHRTDESSTLESAHKMLVRASEAGESLRAVSTTPAIRKEVQLRLVGVYDSIFAVCIDLWKLNESRVHLEDAAHAAEAGRARTLLDRLGDEDLVCKDCPESLMQEYRALKRRVMQLSVLLSRDQGVATLAHWNATIRIPSEYGEQVPNALLPDMGAVDCIWPDYVIDGEQTLADSQAILREFTACLDRVRLHSPEFDPYGPIPLVSLEELIGNLQDRKTVIVQYTVIKNGAVAIVLGAFGVTIRELEQCTLDATVNLALEWDKCYQRFVATLDVQRWESDIEQLLAKVSNIAVSPLAAAIPANTEAVVICPHRNLHVFPLHACYVNENSRLCDLYQVEYAPSLTALHVCGKRDRPEPSRLSLLSSSSNLMFQDVESGCVAEYFDAATVLSKEELTKRAAFETAESSNVWHFAGHGVFDSNIPLESSLILSNGDGPEAKLSVRDIVVWMHLPRNCLTVLGACETGMVRPDILDEYFGFQTAFLLSGAKSVVSSRWLASDLATCIFMSRFYNNWTSGQAVGRSLHNAQLWLRGLPDENGEAIRSGQDLLTYVQDKRLLHYIAEPEQRGRCERRITEVAEKAPDTSPFQSCVYWAAFSACGQCS